MSNRNLKPTAIPWAWCNNNTCLFHQVGPNTQDCILHCDPINAPSEADAKLIVDAVNAYAVMEAILLKQGERIRELIKVLEYCHVFFNAAPQYKYTYVKDINKVLLKAKAGAS